MLILSRYSLPCIVITLTLLTILPEIAYSSAETNGCHCFRNRTFNPEDRFAADDYLLTTTFNSLLASEFDISKRQIIMMKMREAVTNNDLVTALYISGGTELEVSQLLNLKKKQPWQRVINQLKVGKTSPYIEDLFHFITTGVSDDEITEYITNRMIITRFSPTRESLEVLRNSGFTFKQIILAYTLAGQTGTSVVALVDLYRKNGLSWSEIAYNFGLEPASVGKLLEIKSSKEGEK